jgi:hypothetical protein
MEASISSNPGSPMDRLLKGLNIVAQRNDMNKSIYHGLQTHETLKDSKMYPLDDGSFKTSSHWPIID